MKNLSQKSHTAALARTLLWCIGSPSLVQSDQDTRWQADEWCSWRALELAGVVENDVELERLHSFLATEKDPRLGARFERFIEFALERLPNVTTLARRLQVIDAGQTRGEFDFIVQDTASDALEHWEVASKFYLGVPKHGTLHWLGPGKRDSLRRKLRHLDEKQLTLSWEPAADSALARFDGSVHRVRALLKGRLFYPLAGRPHEEDGFCFAGSKGDLRINPRAPRGYWCDSRAFREAAPNRVYRLDKSEWLDPHGNESDLWTPDQVSRAAEAGPVCIDVVTLENLQERWFVVPQGWFDDLDTTALL